MKIGNLDQHCGECGVTEYCGNAFGYCVCTEERFAELDEDEYVRIAENTKNIKKFTTCVNCKRPSCEAYRYSETDFENEDCEWNDEARDFYCKQVAEYVYNTIK